MIILQKESQSRKFSWKRQRNKEEGAEMGNHKVRFKQQQQPHPPGTDGNMPLEAITMIVIGKCELL